jgi:energy-converting hydrogenase Eha subunit F
LAGWDSKLNTNETLFTVLDALMVLLGLAVFNVIHPGMYLPRPYSHTDLPMEKRGEFDGSRRELVA